MKRLALLPILFTVIIALAIMIFLTGRASLVVSAITSGFTGWLAPCRAGDDPAQSRKMGLILLTSLKGGEIKDERTE